MGCSPTVNKKGMAGVTWPGRSSTPTYTLGHSVHHHAILQYFLQKKNSNRIYGSAYCLNCNPKDVSVARHRLLINSYSLHASCPSVLCNGSWNCAIQLLCSPMPFAVTSCSHKNIA